MFVGGGGGGGGGGHPPSGMRRPIPTGTARQANDKYIQYGACALLAGLLRLQTHT